MRTMFVIAALTCGLLAQASKPTPLATAWPKLDAKVHERVKTLYENLMRHEEGLTQKSEAELVTIGAGAAPYLINKLVDAQANANDSLRRVLDQITAREHAALVAAFAKERRVALRHWVVERLAAFAEPTMAPVLQAALKDKEKEISYRAALGLVALGEKSALEPVVARCAEEWAEVGALSLKLVQPGRRTEFGKALLDKIGSAEDTKVKLAALRLLRALGTKDNGSGIGAHLDSEDHAVKKETINALRAIVEGSEPLEELSVFDAIEMAKEWKKRV